MTSSIQTRLINDIRGSPDYSSGLTNSGPQEVESLMQKTASLEVQKMVSSKSSFVNCLGVTSIPEDEPKTSDDAEPETYESDSRLAEDGSSSNSDNLPVRDSLDSINNSLPGYCLVGCRCQCHFSQATTQTPSWFKPILGSLFVSYKSIPLLCSAKCNTQRCQRSKPEMRFTYYFPSWVWARAISFEAAMTSMIDLGLSLRLSFPRVIPFAMDIWSPSVMGDARRLQRMLSDERTVYYPTDVSESGFTILNVGVVFLTFERTAAKRVSKH